MTRIWWGNQSRIATGLPSLASPEDGSGATGPQDISFQGRGNAYVTVGLGADPAARAVFGANGELVKLPASGSWRNVVDVSAYESVANPDGGELDSNPYGVLAVPGGQYVADAGMNALLYVAANGRTNTVAVFPDRPVDFPFPGFPMQAMPTAVALGPDGALYVSQLTGFPFPMDGANVYRVVPGQAPEIAAGGFTNIIDLAFGPDGTLYVLEIATNSLLSSPVGALIRVNADGSQTVLASDGLILPTGLAIGPDGAFYVSNCGACPAGAGQVLRLEP